MAERERAVANLESFDQLLETIAADWGPPSLTRDELRLLCADLQARSLLRLSPTFADVSGEFRYEVILSIPGGAADRPLLIVTPLGRSLLSYMADPDGAHANDTHE